MSAISDFAGRVRTDYARLNTAIEGVKSDVASLNAKIEALQNSQGQITPEDQAILDQIQAEGTALADRLDAVDASTPPTP